MDAAYRGGSAIADGFTRVEPTTRSKRCPAASVHSAGTVTRNNNNDRTLPDGGEGT